MDDLTGHIVAFLGGLLTTGAVAGKLYWHLRRLKSETEKQEGSNKRQDAEAEDKRRHSNWLLDRMQKMLEAAQDRGENRERRMLELEAAIEMRDRRIKELEADLARAQVEDQVIREAGVKGDDDASPAG